MVNNTNIIYSTNNNNVYIIGRTFKGVNMLTKEETEDLYKRISNLEADKETLLSANRKLKDKSGLMGEYQKLQKKHLETIEKVKRMESLITQEKQVRATVMNELKQIKRQLEKQRRKNRDKQEKIDELRG